MRVAELLDRTSLWSPPPLPPPCNPPRRALRPLDDRVKAYARLRGPKAVGWVRHRREGVPARASSSPREGLRVASIDLSEASYSATSLAHDLAVVDVASLLERHGHSVLSERELRRAGEGSISIRVPGASRRASHLPTRDDG